MRIVFDDADRLSMIVPQRKLLLVLIRLIERAVLRHSCVHVVPGLGRYSDLRPSDRRAIVPNVPTEAAVLSSAEEVGLPADSLDARTVVLASGWLGSERGLRMLLRAAMVLPNEDFRFVAVGRLDDEVRSEVFSSPLEYLGSVSNSQALALTRDCDLVVTLYEPSRLVNRMAESNKWGDCLAMGTAIIVNREVVTAEWLVEAGCAFPVSYGDVAELVALLELLRREPARLENAKRVAVAVAAKQGWEQVFGREVLSRLLC